MSIVMVKGQIFSKVTGWLGIIGCTLLLADIVLVTFVPGVKEMAMLVAAPGGILVIVWIFMVSRKLLQLSQ